jgi:hypothetical protein
MQSLRPVRSPVSITIEVDSEPIAGSIAWPEHLELRFCGWLELLVVLDAIHRGERIEPTPEPGLEQ